jgi:hypothetical protein
MSLESASSKNIHRKSALQFVLLSVLWSAGLFLGCVFAYTLPDDSFSLMRMLPLADVSIVSVLAKIFTLLLITPVFFWRDHISIIYLFAFLKAFAFGAIQSLIDLSFVGAGGLMRFLLSFSGIFCNICLLLIWYRHFLDPKQSRKTACMLCAVMLLVIIFDICSVQPFVSALFYQL